MTVRVQHTREAAIRLPSGKNIGHITVRIYEHAGVSRDRAEEITEHGAKAIGLALSYDKGEE